MLKKYTNLTAVPIKSEYIDALVDLHNQCNQRGVSFSNVTFFQNGFCVTFENIDGDAVMHDGTTPYRGYFWETMGMPWDYDDISLHSSIGLAQLLAAYLHGEDWQKYEDC